MAKIFYDHLVVREEVISRLDSYEIDPEEKNELVELVDQTLHHHVLNIIFTHLPKEHHEEFVTLFHASPADENLIIYIREKSGIDIEAQIKKQAEKIKKEILAEIHSSSKKK